MARGFGSVWGTGTDRIASNVTAHTTAQTISLWLYFESSGAGTPFALYKETDYRIAYNGGSNYRYSRHTYTSGARLFTFPRGTINVWEHYLIVDSNTGPTGPLLVFRNGVQVTAGQISTPSGVYVNSVTPLTIGNDDTSDATNGWSGALDHIAVWSTAASTAVSQNVAQALATGTPPIRVYPSEHLALWISNDTGDTNEPIRAGYLAAAHRTTAVGAPRLDGTTQVQVPPEREGYSPYGFGSFMFPPGQVNFVVGITNPETGHTVAAPSLTPTSFTVSPVTASLAVGVSGAAGDGDRPTFTQLHILGLANASQGVEVVAPSQNSFPNVDAQNASLGLHIPSVRLSVRANLGIASNPEMLALATTPALGGIPYSLGVAVAETAPEVADYDIGDKPIGQWTVGTDYVAATANAAGYVALQQNLLNFRAPSGFWGFTTTAPDFNQTGTTVGVANVEQGETADPVDLTQDHILVSVSADAGYTVAAPSLAQPSTEMAVGAASMGVEITAPALGGLQTLSVAGAIQGILAEPPSLFYVTIVDTPSWRTFHVAAESRVLAA